LGVSDGPVRRDRHNPTQNVNRVAVARPGAESIAGAIGFLAIRRGAEHTPPGGSTGRLADLLWIHD